MLYVDLFYMWVFILALCIGSFLNVCIYRIPLKQSIVTTPSHCAVCGERIKWYDLVPVVSYILLRGKCRNCGDKISIRYPLVELLNGVVYLWICFNKGFTVEAIFGCIVFSTLLVVSFIDVEHFIIPNGILIFLFVIGIIYNILTPSLTILDSVIGFFVSSALLWVLGSIFKGGLGGGDIKLMAVAGIVLGWKNILLALFVGSIIGSVISIILINFKIRDKKDYIPFGSYLSVGIIISMIYGSQMIEWYINYIILK